jgi:Peptidase family M28
MKKTFILLFTLLAIFSFSDDNFSHQYAQTINKEDLLEHLSYLSNDNMKGRLTASREQKIAANYIAKHFQANDIQPVFTWDDTTRVLSYYQSFYIKEYFGGRYSPLINPTIENMKSKGVMKSENVLGYIEGTSKKDEIIIISAHYDHIGSQAGVVFNGADDDGSGTVAMMEIAQAFAKAKKEGHPPLRSLLFIGFTGEEQGLLGSDYYTKTPIFDLRKTVCDLNIDMIGRIDRPHRKNPDYIYLIGSDKISLNLHYLSEGINQKTTHLKLDYTYNSESHPLQLYYRSDHYNFAKNGVPIIFYTSGLHDDYHKSTDDVEKIDFDILLKRSQLIFYTAWELAYREEGLK